MKPRFQPCETLSTEPTQACSDFWTAALRENERVFLLNHKICGHSLYSTLSGHVFIHISVKMVKVKSCSEHINMTVMTIIHQLLEADHGQSASSRNPTAECTWLNGRQSRVLQKHPPTNDINIHPITAFQLSWQAMQKEKKKTKHSSL